MSQVLEGTREALQWEIESGWYTLRLGSITFTISPRELYARTTFSDSTFVEARPDFERDGKMAEELGYGNTRAGIVRMWMHHDLLHSWLAWKMKLGTGGALYCVAHGLNDFAAKVANEFEERRVFDLQKLITGKLRPEQASVSQNYPWHPWAQWADEARALLQVLEAGAEG